MLTSHTFLRLAAEVPTPLSCPLATSTSTVLLETVAKLTVPAFEKAVEFCSVSASLCVKVQCWVSN